MIKIFRFIIGYKRFLQNFSSLTIFHFSNYFFTLITLPYLVRILGPGNYGIVNFAASLAAYFSLFIEYGLNISATQITAKIKDDNEKLSLFYWEVFFTRILIFFISSLVFVSIILTFDKFNSQASIYFLSFLAVIGTAFFPQWLFQGTERMEDIAIINIAVKLLWTLSIFFFIKADTDLYKLIFLNSITSIFIGMLGFVVAIIKYQLNFVFPAIDGIKKILINGKEVFISAFSISFYSTTNIFLLGVFADNKIVGYFAVADKIRLAAQVIQYNISEAIFPYVSRLFARSLPSGIKFIKNYGAKIFFLSFTFSAIIFLFSYDIIILLSGDKFLESNKILRILIWVPAVVVIRDTLGKQIMLNTGRNREYMVIYLLAAVFSLIISLILIPLYFANGTAIVLLLTEIFVTICMIIKVKGILTHN